MGKLSVTDKLRAHALKLPEVEEGTSCNKSSYKARNKAFVYLGIKEDSFNLMLKIGPSQGEAKKLAKQYPECFGLGKGGWIKVEFQSDQQPPPGVLQRWIEESYRLLVHKDLVAILDGKGVGKKAVGKKAVGKKAVGKKAVGKKAVGKKAVGKKAVGKKAVGKKAVGKKVAGKKVAGKKRAGR